METLNQFWQTVYPYLTLIVGVLGSVITVIVTFAKSKRSVDRKVDEFLKKIDLEKLMLDTSEKATAKGIEKVKSLTYQTSIQPLVESELQKVNERANDYLKKQLEEVRESYNKLVGVMECFSAYFNHSIGVSEEAKENLRKAIEGAKIDPVTLENSTVEFMIEEMKKNEELEEESEEVKEVERTEVVR